MQVEGLPPLPSELRELMLAERSAPVVSRAVQERLRRRLELTLEGKRTTQASRIRRVVRWVAGLATLRALPRLAVGAACCLVLAMYCTNHDMGGDPVTPRGDGHYRPVLARGDGHMLYLMARSTALDLDWSFDNDLARFGDPWNEPRTKTGRKAIVHPIGPALVWTPLIWASDGAAAVADEFGAGIPLHGYTLWCQRFVFLSSALFGCGAVLLGRRLAMRTIGGKWAASYAAVAVLLGTSLTYYATYMPSYEHAMDAFTCAAFLAYWAHSVGRYDVGRWIRLGLLLGLATLVRTQEIAMGAAVAVEVGVRVVTGRARDGTSWRELARRWVLGGALALAVAIVVWIPQMIEWRIVFGSFTHLPQGSRYTRPGAPMVMELLFSSRHGWFSTTPIAYAGVIGLFLLPRRSRLVAAGLLTIVLLQVYLNSTILDWWGENAFGQRRLCSVSLPLVVGLAALIAQVGRRVRIPRIVGHAVVVLVLGAFVAWNLRAVRRLKAGRAPNDPPQHPICCANVPASFRGMARWLYDRIGDPFEFPANAIFAARHHVPITRWDRVVGVYPMVLPFGDVRAEKPLAGHHGVWAISSPGIQPFLVGGWSASTTNGRRCRFTTAPEATVLVPNLLPYDTLLTLWLSPADARNITIRWNGDVVAQRQLGDGWTPVSFDLPHMALHTNELEVDAQPGATGHGVAVGDLELKLR